MNNIIDEFSDIIINVVVLQSRLDNKIYEQKLRYTFINDSILEYTEIKVFDINKRKYAFQWMMPDYSLIARWDNALHHQHLATFPHHKHTADGLVVESFDISLHDVLTEIRNSINSQ
ncbi:MAG: DUF6516 family protein [Spirosomaceae bacterium]|jgi:hypothetical protein|nr:DUF6516 family protein [Spirosomataceae bacterium]